MNRYFSIFLVCFCSLLLRPAEADTYPSRPVTMVVGFAPGSGIDVVVRIIARRLEVPLGQSVLIENRPGANGALAAGHVARAAPDGYTLFPNGGAISNLPFLMKSLPYDPERDFAPITLLGGFAYMLVVNPQVPARSVSDLVFYAKANPGKLSFATSNTNGLVSGETFKRRAAIDIHHVPYKSAPPAINDLLGGFVSMMFADVTTALPHVRSNALRGLAVTALNRSPLLPELPSLHEAGFTGFDVGSWNGLWAPANTPNEVITKLNTELRKIIDDPELKKQLAALGFDAVSGSPEETAKYAEEQRVKWAKMITDAGIEPQ
jgi:tripartite-type tricarboxylate transporter receptor subunit TctC